MARRLPVNCDFPTIRGAAKRLGIGEKPIRAALRRREILPVSIPGTWPRVAWADVEAWARSKRAPATDHAAARVAEVLEREAKRS